MTTQTRSSAELYQAFVDAVDGGEGILEAWRDYRVARRVEAADEQTAAGERDRAAHDAHRQRLDEWRWLSQEFTRVAPGTSEAAKTRARRKAGRPDVETKWSEPRREYVRRHAAFTGADVNGYDPELPPRPPTAPHPPRRVGLAPESRHQLEHGEPFGDAFEHALRQAEGRAVARHRGDG